MLRGVVPQHRVIRLRLNPVLLCEAYSGYRRLGADVARHAPVVRSRNRAMKVYVTDAERGHLVKNAKAAGLTVSDYLRTIGMGYEVRSVLDHAHVLEVTRARGDLGRIGGLLKLWLSQREGEGAPATDVRDVLNQIEAAALAVKEKVRVL